MKTDYFKKAGLGFLCSILMVGVCSFFACSSDDEEGIIEWEGERYKVEQDSVVRENMVGLTGEFVDIEAYIQYNEKNKVYSLEGMGMSDVIPTDKSNLISEFIVVNLSEEECRHYKGQEIYVTGTYTYNYSSVTRVTYLGSRLSFIPGYDYYDVTVTEVKEKK